MRVSLIKDNIIRHLILPNKVTGNFWITDFDANGNEVNIINIEASNGGWNLISNDEVYCFEGNERVLSKPLVMYSFYSVANSVTGKNLCIYCSPVYDSSFNYYDYASCKDREFTIGKGTSADLVYSFPLLDDIHMKLTYNASSGFTLRCGRSNIGIYVNNSRAEEVQKLKSGDVIFLLGLKIVVLFINGNPYIGIDNPNNTVSCNLPRITLPGVLEPFDEPEEEIDMALYEDKDYFHKKPRFTTSIKELELKVDPPPGKEEEQEQSMLLTIGPMITMSMSSLVTGYVAVSNVMSGNSTWTRALPSIIIAIAMIGSVFVWPSFAKKYAKKQKKEREEKRQAKYQAYINDKIAKIQAEIKIQQNILINTYPKIGECQNIVLNKYTNLWERRIDDEDFMTVSLGFGNTPMKIDIQYPEDSFSMAEDNLKAMVTDLGSTPKNLKDVPIVYSMLDEYISGIIGNNESNYTLMRNIMIQLMTFHSYDDLKIVLFTDKEKEHNWEFLKSLPHNWNDDRTFRYFATSTDEYKEVCYALDKVFTSRKDESKSDRVNPRTFNQIYLIITDSFKAIRNFDFIENVLRTKNNFGFSVLIMANNMASLPDQCKSFITLIKDSGQLFKSSSSNEPQPFIFDNSTIDVDRCAETLANIPIESHNSGEGQLVNTLGFLEMYDVGKVEQLNCMNRWEKNTPILNMQAPVGTGKSGEKIVLDLHEKFHGPHGLIAGMTGSGKSEFIITYILSMAINYHPYEVQFILIDYKGGGLAGAFENPALGIKLPHLVGTITNLDVNEVKRSLASIESELKRRQRAFNTAREISGESTIDIYKYQRMWRDKVVTEPVSHLMIVADEFAELKQQQPEFMEQLISTARIGRSLGVHLILATQKPSGVVDPQIWSNTRFRVCLRVQEKADSTEVIKCPDAAFLKQTGRFYMQVGFNEIFVLGQSAWAGAKYYPSEKIRKTIDTSVSVIDNIANPIMNIETKKKTEKVQAQGEELLSILKYLSVSADEMQLRSRPLWLEKIPAFIRVEDLIKKYDYQPEEFILNPVIGEYDVPNMQEQRLLTVPFSKEGNALVFGSAGSGKENFITTLMYSSMLSYGPHEVNYYVIDFGTEALKCFNTSPLLGDIAYVDDAEKVKNLFKMIAEEMDERKKLFAPYNGDGKNYIKNSGSTVPNIVVIINNFEAYQETYSVYDEELLSLTRDCSRYHIYFMLTISSVNGIRFKLRQNFAQTFVLQQNNDDDYTAVLGNVRKTFPSKIFGRGILRLDNVYEFQTSLVDERDMIMNTVKTKSEELASRFDIFAEPIPTLPEVITNKEIKDYVGVNPDEIILGMDKDTLKIVKQNYKKNFVSLMTGMDVTTITPMLEPLINQMIDVGHTKLMVIDCDELELANTNKELYQYLNSDFDNVFQTLHKFISDSNELYKNNGSNKNVFAGIEHAHVIIIGVDSFKSKVSDNNRLIFGEIFDKARELGVISYTFIDSIDKIKKIELDSWYKNSVDSTQGIWIGDGINDQFTIKISQKSPDSKLTLAPNYCFHIHKGKSSLMKFVEIYDITHK